MGIERWMGVGEGLFSGAQGQERLLGSKKQSTCSTDRAAAVGVGRPGAGMVRSELRSHYVFLFFIVAKYA